MDLLSSEQPTSRSITRAVKAFFSKLAHPKSKPTERNSLVINECPVDSGDNKQLLSKLLLWEQNRLSEFETLEFFQELESSGMVWKMTGAVRRTAALLIREGRIHR
jgi:hypothetical protein